MSARRLPVIAISAAVLAVAGVLMFFGVQSSQRADRAVRTAADTQLALDRSTAERAAAEQLAVQKSAQAAEKSAQAARDKKLVDDAVQKARESMPQPARTTAGSTSTGITLSSLGSKPCAALGSRGVGYHRMLDYYSSFGYPASMDVDHDGYPCETVYGNVN